MSYLEGKYGDSGDEAIRLLGDMMDPQFFSVDDDVDATPDPEVPGVWLVFDHTKMTAFIVYTNEGDAEDVDYAQAVRKYSKRRHVGESVKALRRLVREAVTRAVKEWHEKHPNAERPYYRSTEKIGNEGRDYEPCDMCSSDGRIVKKNAAGQTEYHTCPKCKGTGKLYLGAYGSGEEFD